MFTDSRVPQQLAATPILQTTEFTLDGNTFIDPSAWQLLSDVVGISDQESLAALGARSGCKWKLHC